MNECLGWFIKFRVASTTNTIALRDYRSRVYNHIPGHRFQPVRVRGRQRLGCIDSYWMSGYCNKIERMAAIFQGDQRTNRGYSTVSINFVYVTRADNVENEGIQTIFFTTRCTYIDPSKPCTLPMVFSETISPACCILHPQKYSTVPNM